MHRLSLASSVLASESGWWELCIIYDVYVAAVGVITLFTDILARSNF